MNRWACCPVPDFLSRTPVITDIISLISLQCLACISLGVLAAYYIPLTLYASFYLIDETPSIDIAPHAHMQTPSACPMPWP